MSKVAKRYGVSDVAIHKVCKSLNVPVPPRGYWAKKNAGYKVTQTALPKSDGTVTKTGYRNEDRNLEELEKEYHQSLNFLSDEERIALIEIAIALEDMALSQKMHPILKKHKDEFNDYSKKHPRDEYANWKKDYYRRIPKDEPALWECVTLKALPRLYNILSSLFFAIEKLNGKIISIEHYEIRGEDVFLTVMEGRTKTDHALTKQEQRLLDQYEKERQRYSFASKLQIRKYDYIPNGILTVSAYKNGYIRDTNKKGIESRIGEILIALFMQSEASRHERLAREEAKRKQEEEKRLREIKREQYNQEVERLEILLNETNDYSIACRIREYVAAVEKKGNLSKEMIDWISWARAKADWYDPTVSAEDPIFGERSHGDEEKDKHPTKKGFWSY